MRDRRACDIASVADLNPAVFRLLLAGPRVARLLPFFARRGYVVDVAASGREALGILRTGARHLVLVELELGDMLLPDLLEQVHREGLAGAVILLEDPARSGLIVSAFVRGVDGYVATPPDENMLFRLVERQLLAQWALVQEPVEIQVASAVAPLQEALSLEQAKVEGAHARARRAARGTGSGAGSRSDRPQRL